MRILGKLCALLSSSVMSDSVSPWTVAHQAPLSMGILQAGILEWVAISFSRVHHFRHILRFSSSYSSPTYTQTHTQKISSFPFYLKITVKTE